MHRPRRPGATFHALRLISTASIHLLIGMSNTLAEPSYGLAGSAGGS